jgi:hypothetical protein
MPEARSTTAECDLASAQGFNATIIASDPCFEKDRDDVFISSRFPRRSEARMGGRITEPCDQLEPSGAGTSDSCLKVGC